MSPRLYGHTPVASQSASLSSSPTAGSRKPSSARICARRFLTGRPDQSQEASSAAATPTCRATHPTAAPGTSAPGGRPAWINVAVPPRPLGQLPVPSVEDLAALRAPAALGRRLVSGPSAVSVRDAVTILRLAREIEHDDAVAAAAEARAWAQMFQKGPASTLWTAKRHIDPAKWRAFIDVLRRECEPFAPRDTPSPRRR